MNVLIARRLPNDPLVVGVEEAGFRVFTAALTPSCLPSDDEASALALRAVGDLAAGEYTWLAVTEPAGAWALSQLARESGGSLAESVRRVNVAVTGAATAQVFMASGVPVALRPRGAPDVHALLAAWPSLPFLESDRRALLVDSPFADDTLPRGLQVRGWDVDRVPMYDAAPVAGPSPEADAAWRGGGVEVLVVPDPSAADVIVELLGVPEAQVRVIAIGQETSLACAAVGLPVATTLATPDPDDLIETLA